MLMTRTGRPPSDNPRVKVIPIRLADDEHAAIAEAATRAGVPVGTWARDKLLAAAKRQR